MTHAKKIQSVGPAPAVVSIHAVALYDPKNGRLAHMHHVVTLEGAPQHQPNVHERNAREHAGRLGHDVKTLHALHVLNFQPSRTPLRVDVQKQALVEAPAPQKK
jgi:hypothetical protein